jgi:Type II secretion system (T2SS), protein E, N-terminal domain
VEKLTKSTESTESTDHTENAQHVYKEHLSLVQIATKQPPLLLQRALPRIRRTLRGTDQVFFLGRTCAVVLPATPIEGAQVVARRLSMLLVDVEYTFHILFGAAAQAALQRLRTLGAVEIQVNGVLIEDRMRDNAEYAELGRLAFPEPGEPRYPMLGESGYPEFGPGYLQGDTPTIPAENATVFPDGYPGSTSLPQLAFLSHYPPLRLLHLFPYALAQQYQCVPVGAERGVLTVATSQRLEPAVIAHLQEETQRAIFQVYCEMSIIDDVLRYWQRMLPVAVSLNG